MIKKVFNSIKLIEHTLIRQNNNITKFTHWNTKNGFKDKYFAGLFIANATL